MSHRVLVVGTGFGCRIQVPALRAAGFDVAGLVGTDLERTAERASASGVAKAYIDLDDAIRQTKAKAVAISTPPATHHAVALAALEHGCHVLCEKPFAANAREAAEMLDAAERAGVVHLVGHEFRFVPQRALTARTIASGKIGDPRLFALVQFNSYVSKYADDLPAWWFDASASGGWLAASGSHIVDQVRTELGEIAAVSASLPSVSTVNRAVEDSFIIRLQLENGAEGTVQQTGGAIGPPTALFRVAGTEGSLWSQDAKLLLASRSSSLELEIPADLALPNPEIGTDPRQQTAEWKQLTAIELAPYTQLCLHWRALIEGGPAPGPVAPATFADGLATMKVLEAIRKSAAASGALVAIDR
jgi:predicted dehydrogenase